MPFNGSLVKLLRMRKRQSLQQVADAVGVSKAHVWELETGKSGNPSADLLVRFARHFNTSVAHLIGEDPDAPGEDDQLVAMFRELKGLDPEDRSLVETIMREMRERKRQDWSARRTRASSNAD